jgi:hypothetical protein
MVRIETGPAEALAGIDKRIVSDLVNFERPLDVELDEDRLAVLGEDNTLRGFAAWRVIDPSGHTVLDGEEGDTPELLPTGAWIFRRQVRAIQALRDDPFSVR